MPLPGWTPIFQQLASLKLAVVTLIVLSIAMGFGTVIETHYGRTAAAYFVYNTWWFDAMIGLLGLNVLFSTFSRWPWRKRHIGFVTTHAGILVILVGCLVWQHFGMEGTLALSEGQSGGTIRLDRENIRVEVPTRGERYDLTPNWRGWPFGGPPLNFRLGDTGMRLHVSRRIQSAQPRQEIQGVGSVFNPAVRLRLSGEGFGNFEDWLFALDPQTQREHYGPLSASFQVLHATQELESLLAAPRVDSPAKGMLLLDAGSGTTQRISVDKALDAGAVDIIGSTWTLEVMEYMPHALVRTDEETGESEMYNASDEPRNPFVRVRLHGPDDAHEEHLLFGLFPGFPNQHGLQGPPSGLNLAYEFDLSAAVGDNELRLLLLMPDSQLLAVMPDGQGPRQALPVTLGEPIQTPWNQIAVTIMEFHDNAIVTHGYEPDPKGQNMPAIYATLTRGGDETSMWIPYGVRPRSVRLGQDEVRLSLGPEMYDLGFALRLMNFHNPTYGGTTMAARYYSEVEVLADDEPGEPRTVTIAMNSPLDKGGFRIFQSGFQEPANAPKISIFSVAASPGLELVYLGCLIMCVGICIIFYMPKENTPARS